MLTYLARSYSKCHAAAVIHHDMCILGMDMTVTAPLDMGTGQQRYVVAYTLKQGIEKQPDILNAQKSTYTTI